MNPFLRLHSTLSEYQHVFKYSANLGVQSFCHSICQNLGLRAVNIAGTEGFSGSLYDFDRLQRSAFNDECATVKYYIFGYKEAQSGRICYNGHNLI